VSGLGFLKGISRILLICIIEFFIIQVHPVADFTALFPLKLLLYCEGMNRFGLF